MTALTHSIKETCALLSLGSTKVYELIKARELVALKIGRKTLITHESIQGLLARALVSGEA